MSDDAAKTMHEKSMDKTQSGNGPPDETTYKRALDQIRINIQDATRNRVHIYSFNIPEDSLREAYALLDKEVERKSMRVTYSPSCNFVVRYMPSRVHEVAATNWAFVVTHALNGLLLTPPEPLPPGCEAMGASTFQLGQRQKQPDMCFGPNSLGCPSIVLEVGDSKSLTQLRLDARLWLEHMPEVELVAIILIDPPRPAHSITPAIMVQLWKGQPPTQPPHTAAAQQREGYLVWEADWSINVTPMYLLLSDIFRAQIPAAYGNHDRAMLDTAWLRQKIINAYV